MVSCFSCFSCELGYMDSGASPEHAEEQAAESEAEWQAATEDGAHDVPPVPPVPLSRNLSAVERARAANQQQHRQTAAHRAPARAKSSALQRARAANARRRATSAQDPQ